MKTSFRAVIALMFAFTSLGFGQVSFDIGHGSLTLISNDGVWRRFATEFPIAGGWMSPNSPTGTSNGPNGDIWVHRYHGSHTGENLGVYHTPITLNQYNEPSTINPLGLGEFIGFMTRTKFWSAGANEARHRFRMKLGQGTTFRLESPLGILEQKFKTRLASICGLQLNPRR